MKLYVNTANNFYVLFVLCIVLAVSFPGYASPLSTLLTKEDLELEAELGKEAYVSNPRYGDAQNQWVCMKEYLYSSASCWNTEIDFDIARTRSVVKPSVEVALGNHRVMYLFAANEKYPQCKRSEKALDKILIDDPEFCFFGALLFNRVDHDTYRDVPPTEEGWLVHKVKSKHGEWTSLSYVTLLH